jgi:hypothetical protein
MHGGRGKAFYGQNPLRGARTRQHQKGPGKCAEARHLKKREVSDAHARALILPFVRPPPQSAGTLKVIHSRLTTKKFLNERHSREWTVRLNGQTIVSLHPINPKRDLAQDYVGHEYREVTQHIAALGFATKMGVGTALDWRGLRQPMPRTLTSLTRSKPRFGNGVADYCSTNPAFFVSVVNWGAVAFVALIGACLAAIVAVEMGSIG